jgi:hypothetical protein
MTIFETFTKRQKRLANSGKQDVYQYDDLPKEFRIQVIHIWKGAIGAYFEGDYGRHSPANQFWSLIHDILARESGVFSLVQGEIRPDSKCIAFLASADTGGALDIIELSFRVIETLVSQLDDYDRNQARIKERAADAIEELNGRFQEHGIGYQYMGGYLVRLDSQFAHAEIVKPALSLLNVAGFDGPADEFIRSFDHYRHGRNKEAVAEALKAFESTMKSICGARNWTHPPNATAIPLIKILIDKGLIPGELENYFSGLRSAMQSGLPTLANKTSRHGQGAVPIQIPSHFAGYALHLTASNIIFLVEAHKALP